MPSDKKKTATEMFGAKYPLRPFTIHYIYLGEKDIMEVWEYSPKRARKKFTKKYPAYKILKTTLGDFEKPEKKEASKLDLQLNNEIFNFKDLLK